MVPERSLRALSQLPRLVRAKRKAVRLKFLTTNRKPCQAQGASPFNFSTGIVRVTNDIAGISTCFSALCVVRVGFANEDFPVRWVKGPPAWVPEVDHSTNSLA